MEELIQVTGPDGSASSTDAPGMTGAAKAVSVVSMTFFWGVVLWTGGSEILSPPAVVQLVGQEAAAAREAKEKRDFWDGSLARSFETNFRLGGNVRRKVGPYWSLAMLKIGDVISSEVIIGKDQWLFLRDRVTLKASNTDQGKVIFPNFMGALNRSLAAHGTTLVALPLLRKGVACEERLPDGLDPDPQLDRDIIDNLAALGIRTVDVFDKWRSMAPDDVYKIQDTHWALKARAEVVKELARTVPEIPRDEEGVWHTFGGSRLNGGNLNYIGISPRHPIAKLTSATSEKDINLFPDSFALGLKDGTWPSRMLLVGTSFSAGFQFREVLAAFLRAGVDDASEFGQPILGSLKTALETRFDKLPEFLLVEFPLYQAAKTTRVLDPLNEAVGTVLVELNGDLEYDRAPQHLMAEPESGKRSGGEMYWSYAPGALISSGDGVLLLELEFEGESPSEWMLSMGGARVPISVPAGRVRRVLPLIEGPVVADRLTLLPRNTEASSAQFGANVVMDVSLERARPALGTGGENGTWGYQGQLSVARFDAVAVQWTDDIDMPLGVTVTGVDAQGAPAEQSWTMTEPASSRFALFTVGAFVGGEITEIQVIGVAGDVQVSIAPKPRAE